MMIIRSHCFVQKDMIFGYLNYTVTYVISAFGYFSYNLQLKVSTFKLSKSTICKIILYIVFHAEFSHIAALYNVNTT